MSELNIYQRLSKITEELGYVAKGLTVGDGKNQYKAVSEGDVLNAVKPLEIKYGVYSYPLQRSIVSQDILETDKGTYTKTSFFMRVETVYRFVNTDLPSEFVDVMTYGDGVDGLDKAPGKAMTYADKYALLKAYKIQTGDDPDQTHSDDIKVRKPKPEPPKEKYAPTNDSLEVKAEQDRIKKLNDTLLSLEKPDNIEFKPLIMKYVCDTVGVSKWEDIKFTNSFTYQKFIELVKKQLETEKMLAQAGI